MIKAIGVIIHKFRLWKYLRVLKIPQYHPIYEKFFGVEPGDVVIDVGACIGEFTLIAAQRASRVVAVEPEPTNFKYLVKNVDKLNLNNIILVNKALSKATGKVRMYVAINPLSHTIYENRTLSRKYKVIEVEATTLDKLLEELRINSVDFIKIDVEGAEVDVLIGGTKTLRLAKKVVLEYHRGSEMLNEIIAILKRAVFNNIIVDNNIIYAYKQSDCTRY